MPRFIHSLYSFAKKNVNLFIFIFVVAIIMRLKMVSANMMLGGNNSFTLMMKLGGFESDQEDDDAEMDFKRQHMKMMMVMGWV